jgi:hypothetical protein
MGGIIGCVGRSTMVRNLRQWIQRQSTTVLTPLPLSPLLNAAICQIARAQDWVNRHVPYSQTGSYGGYRTDCSGTIELPDAVFGPKKHALSKPTLPHWGTECGL